MKFERQFRHVVKDGGTYRVTWDSVTSAVREVKDPARHLVGIAAALAYWDTVDGHKECLACAKAVKEAWDAGDRYLLDTSDARQKAELVADLAVTQPEEQDICAALADLLNEIARVRLTALQLEDFEVLPTLMRGLEACFAVPGFQSWPVRAQRRRFLYALRHADRTPLVQTLSSLYFNEGTTPLLTSRQRAELLALDRGDGLDGARLYLDDCLRLITAWRFS